MIAFPKQSNLYCTGFNYNSNHQFTFGHTLPRGAEKCVPIPPIFLISPYSAGISNQTGLKSIMLSSTNSEIYPIASIQEPIPSIIIEINKT